MTIIDKLVVEIDSDTRGLSKGIDTAIKKVHGLDDIVNKLDKLKQKNQQSQAELLDLQDAKMAAIAAKAGLYAAAVGSAVGAWKLIDGAMKDVEKNSEKLLKTGMVTEDEVDRAKEWNKDVKDTWTGAVSRPYYAATGAIASAMQFVDRDIENDETIIGKDSIYRSGFDFWANMMWPGGNKSLPGLTEKQKAEFDARRANAPDVGFDELKKMQGKNADTETNKKQLSELEMQTLLLKNIAASGGGGVLVDDNLNVTDKK